MSLDRGLLAIFFVLLFLHLFHFGDIVYIVYVGVEHMILLLSIPSV